MLNGPEHPSAKGRHGTSLGIYKALPDESDGYQHRSYDRTRSTQREYATWINIKVVDSFDIEKCNVVKSVCRWDAGAMYKGSWENGKAPVHASIRESGPRESCYHKRIVWGISILVEPCAKSN